MTSYPRVLNGADFANHCYAQLGALQLPDGTSDQQLMAGVARRGAILLACKNTADPATFEVYTRFMKADAYVFDDNRTLMQVIGPAGSGIVTAQEAAAIIGNWPSVQS